ncbi:MAG: rhodanese-like domain-containing protein [Flavobacteriales bacterium]
MRKLLFIIPLGLSLTAMSCSNNVEPTSSEEKVATVEQENETISKDINVAEFSELIAKGEGQVLDVRTPDEWASGIVKGATKMNFFDNDFNTQLEKLDKNKPVYVYCKSGGRSGKATKQMKEMGFTAVYNLIGGIGAWDAAGKEKVK